VPFFLATSGRIEETRTIADETIAKAEAAGVPCSISIAYLGKGVAR